MHLKKVAVPVRLPQNHIGSAILLAARVRPKFIGGERAIYDENLKIYRDWKATMEYAVENAEAKGSRLTALRTAWNLKRIGLDPSVIAQCTGLSLEEINDLENLIRKEEIKC